MSEVNLKKEKIFSKLLKKIRKDLPKSNFIQWIFVILKLLPLYIFSHDWNLNYETGLSRNLLFSIFLYNPAKLETKSFLYLLIIIFLVLAFISIACYTYTYYLMKQYGKFSKCMKNLFSITTKILYFSSIFLLGQFYSISVSNYFCKGEYNSSNEIISLSNNCRSTMNYVVNIIQSMLIIYFNIISYIILLISYSPFFTTKNILTNGLFSVNYRWLILPIFQAVIQLEFFIPFSFMIYIKVAIRALAFIIMICFIFRNVKQFYTNYLLYNFESFIYISSAVSISIEFCVLYDFSNDLIKLQSNFTIISLKLIFEVILTLVIMRIIQIKQNNFVDLGMYSSSNAVVFFETCNKFFNNFNNFSKNRRNIKIIKEIIEKFSDFFACHKNSGKCLKYNRDCFCMKYDIKDVSISCRNFTKYFLNLNQPQLSRLEKSKFLKSHLKCFYDYLEHNLNSSLENYKSHEDQLYSVNILLLALFYFSFEKNFARSLFYINEFTKTGSYKNSYTIRICIEFLKIEIAEKFKKENKKLHKEMTFRNDMNCGSNLDTNPLTKINKSSQFKTNKETFEMYMCFNKIKNSIILDNLIKNSFTNYSNFLNQLIDKQITVELLSNLSQEFFDRYEYSQNVIDNIILKKRSEIQPVIALKLNLCNKFILNNPSLSIILEDKLKRIQFLQMENLINDNINCMILNVEMFHEKPKLIIEYATPLVSEELNYTTKELSQKDFSELLPSYIADYHITFIIESIKAGNTKITENQMVFLTKDNYCKLFNFNAYVVLSSQQIKIFVSIGQVQLSSESLKSSFDSKNFTQNKDQNNVHDNTCFLLADVFGYIFGISKEFENYLYLPYAIVNKLGLNIFKDILKCEISLSKFNKKIIKSLINVYQNIAELNIPQISEMHNTEEYRRFYFEFSNLRLNSNHILNGVKVHVLFEENCLKLGRQEKIYYFVRFVVDTKHIDIWRETEINRRREKRFDNFINHNQEKVNTENILTLSYDKYDIIKRIFQVREFSMAILRLNYNLSIDNINKTESKWDSQKIRQISSLESIKLNSFQLKGKIKSQIFSLFVFITIFTILLTIISILKDNYSDMGNNYLMSSQYFLISKNIFYSSVTSLLLMQIRANNIQDDLIDNKFDNSYNFHKQNLEKRIEDFSNYFRFFQKHHGLINDKNLMKIDSLFKENFHYKTLNLKMQSETINSTLWESLYYWHLINNRILETNKLIPLFFNKTDNDGSQYYRTDYDYSNMNYNAEYSTVLVIENSMTFMKYSLDEISMEYGYSIKRLTDHSKILFLALYGGLSIFILVVFLIQPCTFNKLHKIIFAKYFVNYNNIVFFHTLITEKLKIIINFIDNSGIENLKSLNINSLELTVSEVEENFLNFDFEQEVELGLNLMIKPFDVIIKEEIVLNNENGVNSTLNRSNPTIRNFSHNKSSGISENLNFSLNNSLINSKILNNSNKYEMLPDAEISSNKRIDEISKVSSELRDMRNLLKSELNEIKEEIYEYSVDIDKIEKDHKKANSKLINANIDKIPNNKNSYKANKNIKETVISHNKKYLGSSLFSETPKSLSSKDSKQAMIGPIITLSSRIVSKKKGKFLRNLKFSKSTNNDKRDTTDASKTSTTLQNMTVGSLLNTKESETSKSNLLIDNSSFKKQFIVLISFASLVFILVFINYFIIQNNLNNYLISLKFYKIIFERFSIINELLLSYQISVLKSKPIKNQNKIIFEEISEKYQSMNKEIANLQNNEEFLKLYNETIVFETQLNSENFCEILSKRINHNIMNDNFKNIFPISNMISNIEESQIFDECIRIGRGFNKNGLSPAFENIYKTLLDLYNDFVLDETKTSKKNYSRLNDVNLYTIQIEVDFLFSKIYFLYSQLMYQDESKFSVIHFSYLIYGIILFMTFVLFFIFFFIFSRRMMKQDKLLEKIEEINLNSLIF